MSQKSARSVFVGNIPYDASEEDIRKICEQVGPVVSFRLVIDRETGKAKGYGFCEYKDEETAQSARRNLQGHDINGRQLRVDFAESDKGTAERNAARGAAAAAAPAILSINGQQSQVGFSAATSASQVVAATLGVSPMALGGTSSDPLTSQLAGMSKHQLYDLLAQMKVLIQTNPAQARAILIANPQLAKGLFQAQVMLGMVKPLHQGQPSLYQQPSAGQYRQQSIQQTGLGQQSMAAQQAPSQGLPHHPGYSRGAPSQQLGASTSSYQHQPQPSVGQQSHFQALPTQYTHPQPPLHQPFHQAAIPPLQQQQQQQIGFSQGLQTQSAGVTSGAYNTYPQQSFGAPVQPQSSGVALFGSHQGQPPPLQQDLDQQQSLLLQQVMQLTPEQVNLLPPEQRMQVLQLQQALK